MPLMDGFEVLTRIRQLDREAGRHAAPAIAVTAYVSAEYRARCLRAGFQRVVTKPLNTVVLVSTVVEATATV